MKLRDTRALSLRVLDSAGLFKTYSETMSVISWLKSTPLSFLVTRWTRTLGAIAGSTTCSLPDFRAILELSDGCGSVDCKAAGRCFVGESSPAKQPDLFVKRVSIIFCQDDDTLKTAAGSTRLWGHRLLPKTRSAAVLFPFEVTA